MTIEKWAKDFKSYVNALDMPRDDYKGIMEYIDDALDMLKERQSQIEILEYKLAVAENNLNYYINGND